MTALATRPAQQSPPAGLVARVGAARRVRALMALGHNSETIGAAAGITGRLVLKVVYTPGPWVTAARYEQVCVAYEALSMRAGSDSRVRQWALERGWAPPLAWDDEDLDDPDATPDGVLRPSRRGRPNEAFVEDIEWLLTVDPRATPLQLADRFRMTTDGVYAAVRRAGREDLHDRLARNAYLCGHNPGRSTGDEVLLNAAVTTRALRALTLDDPFDQEKAS